MFVKEDDIPHAQLESPHARYQTFTVAISPSLGLDCKLP